MHRKKRRLQTTLISLFILIGAVPAIVVMIMSIGLTTSSTEKIVGVYTERIIEQLNYNVENYILTARSAMGDVVSSNYVQKAANKYLTLGAEEQSVLRSELTEKILPVVKTQEALEGMYICGEDSIYFQNNKGKDDFDLKAFKETSAYQKLQQAENTDFIWFCLSNEEATDLYVARKVSGGGFVVFEMNGEILTELIDLANVAQCMSLTIVDEEDNVIRKTEGAAAIDEKLMSQFENEQDESMTKSLDNNLISVIKCSNGWQIISVAPESNLMRGFTQSCKVLVGVLLICMVIAAGISLLIGKKITAPIVKMADYMKKAEAGDFSIGQQISSNIRQGNIEMAKLVSGFCSMLKSLNEMIATSKKVTLSVMDTTSTLTDRAQKTSTAAEEISHTTESIASGAMKQRDEMEDAVQFVEELSEHVNGVSQIVEDIGERSHEAMAMSTQTREDLNALYKQSEKNISISQKVIDSVKGLGEETTHINSILEQVKGINKQTNLLAINASIEAARAGESGKGFSVVADEVRKLSMEIEQAILNIGSVMKRIDDKRDESLEGLNEAINIFNEQLPLVEHVNGSFSHIYSSMNGIDGQISTTHHLISEVADKEKAIQDKVRAIAKIAEEFACTIEEANAATTEQVEAANQMKEMAADLLSVVHTLEQCYD